MATTTHNVGDILSSDKSGYYLKVTSIEADGSFMVGVYAPTGKDEYWFGDNGNTSLLMENGGGHHITDSVHYVQIKTVDYSYVTKAVYPWNWHGNKQSAYYIEYGNGPWNVNVSYNYPPHLPDHPLTSLWMTGLSTSEWEYVSGSYAWADGPTDGDWYGWVYNSTGWNDGGTINHYGRGITYKVKSKTPQKIATIATIQIDGFVTPPPDEPPDEPVPDTSIPDIIVRDSDNDDESIPEDYDYTRNCDVKPYWEIDDTKYEWHFLRRVYTDNDGVQCTNSTTGINNNTALTKFGKYEFTIEASNLETPSITISTDYTIIIVDPTPPDDFNIFDKVTPSVIYSLNNKVYLGPCYPTINIPVGCIVSSCTLNGNPYTLGSPISENGNYDIIVMVKKSSNSLTLTKEGLFVIDNIPSGPPIINVHDGNLYQGQDYGLVGYFPNPITMEITVDNGAIITDETIWYRPDSISDWQPLNPVESSMTLSNKGEYKITARSKKLSNGLYSAYSAIVVYKKNKYTWTITLNPDQLCYRTIATPNFSADASLKFQYKIDDNGWQWYHDPVKIYKNCTFYVRSLDGDDDYESNITAKVIDIIDSAVPNTPIIQGVEDDGIYIGTVIPTLAP